MALRRVSSEADRERIRVFFRENLPDRTGFQIPSREFDRDVRAPSILRIDENESGEIRGAAFASNDPEDIVHWLNQGNVELARLISEELLMVHEIAVVPEARRSGLGNKLLRQVIDDGLAAGATIATVVFDDSTPGLEKFYRQAGLVALPRRTQFALKFAASPHILGFPQTRPTYRWAYRILNPSRVNYVP